MQIERERLIDIREKVDRAREFHISHCRGRNFSFKYCSICSEGNFYLFNGTRKLTFFLMLKIIV